MKIAHIINPVYVDEGSELAIAQPITFASMRAARAEAQGQVTVDLHWSGYPEDEPAAPAGFAATPFLTQSVLDHGAFSRARKLPLLADILSRLYAATDAEFCVYSNVDIALQPQFYVEVARIIEGGCDGFVINRRTISRAYEDPTDLPQMYAQTGAPHRGWDCFIFRREAIPRFKLGRLCLGAARVGIGMYANVLATATRFAEFKSLHLTFHLGDDRAWRQGGRSPYTEFNTRELMKCLAELEQAHGPFSRRSAPGAFLWRKRTFGQLYEWWAHASLLPTRWSHQVNRLLGRGNP